MMEREVTMEFTYKEYSRIIAQLKAAEYKITNYHDSDDVSSNEKKVILRHDVDLSLERAADFSSFEKDLGVSSTYYVLVTSNFYNVIESSSRKAIDTILCNGHEIGLHFDETQYKKQLRETTDRSLRLSELICREAQIMEQVIGKGYKVKTVSMHIPSKATLDSDLKINGIINSYSQEFFRNWKYLSDSEMRWREDVFSIIKSGKYDKLHILTHPFWYSEVKEDKYKKVLDFLKEKKHSTFEHMNVIVPGIEQYIECEVY